MNSVFPLYRRLWVMVLWLLVVCLAAHFLHDLQPNHLDPQDGGFLSRVCLMAIHSGALKGFVPGITFVVGILLVVCFSPLFQHPGSIAILLPPPIHA